MSIFLVIVQILDGPSSCDKDLESFWMILFYVKALVMGLNVAL